MALILKSLYNQYLHLEQTRDHRLDNLPLATPIQAIIASVIYLYFTKVWGTRFMRNRKPFELRKSLIIYNILQIFLNATIFVLGVLWLLLYSRGKNDVICLHFDYTKSVGGIRTALLIYSYVLLKYLDLADTVFIILRKKYSQASFLHVYHHVMVLLSATAMLNFAPGGPILYMGIANLVVHIIMYGYYLSAIINPKIKNQLWLKKKITMLQILQFCFNAYIAARSSFLNICNVGHKPFICFSFLQNCVLIYLFLNFFIRTYVNRKEKN